MPASRPAMILAAVAALALPPAPAHAQSGKPPTVESPGADAVGAEALALFDRICVAALGRGVPPVEVARAELSGATAVPAERLRSMGQVRETAAWRVRGQHGQYSVVMMEPGTQCGIFAEGVSPEGFLEAARRLMVSADRFPGWRRLGEPQTSVQQRPYGRLTYLSVAYAPAQPPRGGAAPQDARVTASAANRTDGRPDTAVISTAFAPRSMR